jgi:transcriptional regulator with XRE-family HTH domain
MATAGPATPEQTYRYGHIAAALRQLMTQRGWKHADLCAAMGLEKTATTPYIWLSAKGAPSEDYRKRLRKAFPEVPEDAWKPRPDSSAYAPPHVFDTAPANPVVAKPNTPASTVTIIPSEVFSMSVTSDGQARVRFEKVMTMAEAYQLMETIKELIRPAEEPKPNGLDC